MKMIAANGRVLSASVHESFGASGKNASIPSSTLDEDGRCDDACMWTAWRKPDGGLNGGGRSAGAVGRIPHELWRAAVKAAAVHGGEAVAADLGVEVDRLQQWMHVVADGEPAMWILDRIAAKHGYSTLMLSAAQLADRDRATELARRADRLVINASELELLVGPVGDVVNQMCRLAEQASAT